MMAAPSIDQLLVLVSQPGGPAQVAALLEQHAQLATKADSNGYTLLHASASYEALDLARLLVRQHGMDVDVRDADGDTPLYFCERHSTARMFVEELGAKVDVENDEGANPVENAEENAEGDESGEWTHVVRYLKSLLGQETGTSAHDSSASNTTSGVSTAQAQTSLDAVPSDIMNGDTSRAATRHPPPLPPGVEINFGAMREADVGDAADADPEFRRRIEELAARDDFESESGQRELRRLVEDAVGGLAEGEAGDASRRRVDG